MLQIKVPFLPMSAWLPKVVEPSKQQGLAAVFFLILYPYYLIREKITKVNKLFKSLNLSKQITKPLSLLYLIIILDGKLVNDADMWDKGRPCHG